MRSTSRLAALAWLGLAVASGRAARAQAVDRRYAEEPTAGLALPAAPLAGEVDARSTTVSPGGLALLRGPELALVLAAEDEAVADRAGAGAGVFVAAPVGGGALPRLGVGLALEWLRPARRALLPDPGAPFRFTWSTAVALGRRGGLGVAWHRYVAEGALAGVTAVDLGLSYRLGNRAGVAAGLRDLATGPIAGAPVQRRYEAELALRPLGTSRVELGLGGRIGETRGDLDGWARLSARVADGALLHAAVETDALHLVDASATGTLGHDGRDLRATVGLELALDGLSVATYATGLRDAGGARRPLGATFVARVVAAPATSLLAPADHLERLELGGEPSAREVTRLVTRLRRIGRDPSARGVVVVFEGLGGGYATAEELRGELVALRHAGKKVFAYLVAAGGRDYYVASAADRIYLDPAGELRLVGLAVTTLYLRGALELVGVRPQFEKIAEYKSAPEQFTEAGPSEPAARMREELLDDVWGRWLDAIADGRRLDRAAVQALVDAGPYTAGELARDHRLVDAVAPPDEVGRLIAGELGAAYPVAATDAPAPDRWERPRIAVIYVDGDIVEGPTRTLPLLGKMVGADAVRQALVAARADASIAAVVLRIASPGGSALASELIAREVFALRGVKPIVCSMGDVAASGGYFVAAGCDRVFAEPTTLTGSIGIFSGKFDLSGLLARAGVTTSTAARGAHADAESAYRPWTAEERRALQARLGYAYGRFLGAVASGRGLSRGAVDEVGRGHVWTGAQARERRLVDELGGLAAALAEAAARAGLREGYELVELPDEPTSLLGLVGRLAGLRAPAPLGLDALPLVRAALGGLLPSLLLAPDAAQARLPFELRWE